MSQDSTVFEIKNTCKILNSKFPDYAPVISADGEYMLFTSRRPVTPKEINKNKMSNEKVYESYFDKKTEKWSKPEVLPEPVNQPGRNNSAIAISNDGQRMLLYQDDENGNGDIWESLLDGIWWSVPVRLPEPVNSPDHESSAAFAPDGNTLYFVSNRPGGLGGRDIWYCIKKADGKWGMAVNMGAPVNSNKDEEGVYVHPDGRTLYFSSKGHNSIGGYDIFVSSLSDGKWTEPKGMGAPINTKEDDLYMVVRADGKKAYYSTILAGGTGEKDIYEVEFKTVAVSKKETWPKLTLLKGVITDEQTGTPLEAKIEITDNVKNEVIFVLNSNKTSGKYLVSLPAGRNYGIRAATPGYLFHSENFDIPDTARYQEVVKDIQLMKIEVGKKIILNNIFFDYDKATLRSESAAELKSIIELLNEIPTLKIEISGHTDNIGAYQYNISLSESRAKAVVEYLVSKGINNSRLKYKGYAYDQPIATNDTEEGRQQNRRVEFIILSK